jgi:GT2 family glycosyltransferase
LPFISVVVPAYQRPAGLGALFQALGEQSYPPYRFEVLVCDDGSTPPLAERVPAKDLPFSVRFLRGENAGPATARNRGIAEARGTIVAFTDDDCVPDPEWLEAIAQAMADPAVYAVHGPTRSSVPPIDPFVHSIHISREHGVATANFAVRKEKLVAVGGFDETFGAPYFEDEDLSRRLQARFGPITWAEGVRVEHPPRAGSVAGAWRAAGFYRWLPYMQGQHPGYWAGAIGAIRRRALAKAALVLLGLSPLVGAPASLGLAWLGLLAWQARRLQRALTQAVDHRWRIPPGAQLAFLLGEWLLDFRRWAAYASGRGMETKRRGGEIEELGF